MDSRHEERDEFSVSESAFWHTNMDLYYGYQLGEVVEVEHEFNKYWLATIKYSFKHLILLKWIGDYGEFWIDTSMQNLTSAPNHVFDEITGPKRLFPPGYHLQSQLKSQFTLERPSKVLVKPSLYNPINDPYAEIKTVEDLLAHEFSQESDAFGNKTTSVIGEPAGLSMATCKTTIAYGQEDVDELEAALMNLSETWDPEAPSDSTYGSNINSSNSTNTISNDNSSSTKSGHVSSEDPTVDSLIKSQPIEDKQKTTHEATSPKLEDSKKVTKDENEPQPEVDHDAFLKICKTIQETAITKGRYLGVGENSKKVYYLKPKQFFDLGGANHEKAIVPGTLLEVCQTSEGPQGVEVFHWIATVTKNMGGRLRLRWFMCDSPKFKQGRLEMKSCKSEFIREEDEEDGSHLDLENPGTVSKSRLNAKEITFSMHFCNPCIYTVGHGQVHSRPYQMPKKLFSFIESMKGSEGALEYESVQMDYIFDPRRMNLDKERPLIDHLLSTARWLIPKYIDLSFAMKDKLNTREVLVSTPKTTKLLKGHIQTELAPGVFEVHSEPTPDNSGIVKFVYPYDSSYSILPLDWAIDNQECLSVDPSRNPTPTLLEKTSLSNEKSDEANEKVAQLELKLEQNDNQTNDDQSNLKEKSKYESIKIEPFTLLCEIAKSNVKLEEINLNDELVSRSEDFDAQEPSCWSKLIRLNELQAPEFICKLNYSFKDEITSRFRVMDQLEVVHPSSDATICLGRIRKIAFPLLWIQISADSYTLLPFSSTEIYPKGWCESNGHPLISLLPPRKRSNQSSQPDKKRKKVKNSDGSEGESRIVQRATYEKEHFDLDALNDKQLDIDYILNEKSTYVRIYFNHKCFTGPSLSKGKICSLPQYVGPGPLRLVMEEVVTKVISVAYVPPRILNDLSSKSFEDLLIARNLTNTTRTEFKAKYQKRVHGEDIPVCLSLNDVALYCECLCEHLKCCYNLIGPNLYDGDDCPGHCRALTKSNKFMKRATYYREKARLGEFVNDGGSGKKPTNNNNSQASKTSRPLYAGRDSSESTSSMN